MQSYVDIIHVLANIHASEQFKQNGKSILT